MGRPDVPEDVKQAFLAFRRNLEEKDKKLETYARTNDELLTQLHSDKRTREIMNNRLQYNPITGLPNHSVLEIQTHRLLSEREQEMPKRSFAVIFLQFNDNYGLIKRTLDASIGEWVLYETSERIRRSLPEGSFLYHSREDEFSFIVPDAQTEGAIEEILHRVYHIVTKAHRFPGQNFSIGSSMGIARYPENGHTKNLLLRNADIALEYAKKRGKEYVFFRDEMRDEVIEKIELQDAIIKALEQQAILEIKKQFELHYQPLIDLVMVDGRIQGLPYGAEALIRWHHPTRGLVSPAKFIPVAEETGLIIPIGNWVLYETVNQLRRWHNTVCGDCVVAINLSPRQFKSEGLVDMIKRVLDKDDVAPEFLELEITESSVMEDPEAAISKLLKLRDMGIKIAIDDFGTGYSSLSYLKDLPVDKIKIDKAFVETLPHDTSNQSIVQALIDMARRLKVDVLSEGIETSEQLSCLYDLGCRKIQGYYFQTPLSGPDFFEYYKKSREGVFGTNYLRMGSPFAR